MANLIEAFIWITTTISAISVSSLACGTVSIHVTWTALFRCFMDSSSVYDLVRLGFYCSRVEWGDRITVMYTMEKWC